MEKKQNQSVSYEVPAVEILAERRAILDRLAMLDQSSVMRERAVAGDNTPVSDPLEEAQEATSKLDLLATRGVLVARLKSLARTFQKIREGTYGRCDQCEEPIPLLRLQAVPEAVYCIRCATEMESPSPSRSGRIR